MFKAVKADPVTYCDDEQHVLLGIPANPRAYETYDISVTKCDCEKQAPTAAEFDHWA